jgi:hypothetical protein
MKKLVNGKVVDIDNIELFELAAEVTALQNTAVSITADGIEANINSPLIRKYIKQYDAFFKAMPYPLYAVETDVKYATLGNFIKSLSKEHIAMWVDNGLCIKLDKDTGMTLRIVNNTWSITYTKEERTDNTSMELYKDSVGYNEYSWILRRVLSKESTSGFYAEFMGEFLKACNNQPMVIKWELENMLTFGTIPNKTEFRPNKIICPDANEEYSLDIFCTGVAETDEQTTSWDLTGSGPSANVKYKTIKTYGFDAYAKPLSDGSKTSGKLEKCKVTGLHNLFMQLCAIKSANDMSRFPNFEGIITDNMIVFVIDNRLYMTKSNRLMEPKDIAHGIELYTVDKGKIYFIKSKRINDKISKEYLYSYAMKTGALRLCKIVFSY